jgi:glyoxylase-like metal-dependent hydrolase (beta-lactamase superfamily II)
VRYHVRIAVAWAVAVWGGSCAWAQDATVNAAGPRGITRIRDDLYLARDGQQYTVFVVTPDGVILGDPLSRETALWLRDEIRVRFGQNVRFVLHTCHNYTRATGASVFSDTAVIVATSRFPSELAKARRDQPELYRFDARPTPGYLGQRTITLGGETVELIPVVGRRSPDMAMLQFRREHVVFAADPPAIGSVPFSFGAFSPSEVFAWLDAVAALEFDSLVLSDGRIVPRAEFDALAAYLRALRAAVSSGVRAGRTLSEIQRSATLDRFRTNAHWTNRASQLSDIQTGTTWTVWQASAGAATSYGVLSAEFCASRTTCSGGGAVPAARFAVSAFGAGGLGLSGEATFSGQTWSARTGPDVDQEAATDRWRAAVLVRYGRRASGFSWALVGGPSFTRDHVRGVDNVKSLGPDGGSHSFDRHDSYFGLTVGGDLERRLGRLMTIRIPVRVTRLVVNDVPPPYLDSTLDLQAGVDITFQWFRRVSLR